MTIPQDPQQFVGRTAVDAEGAKVGKIGQVYLDNRTSQPVWITVTTGLFGTRQSFAPIYGSRIEGEQVVLAVTKNQVKDAPNIDDDAHISGSEQDALYAHYSAFFNPAGQASDEEQSRQAGYDTSGQGGYETASQAGCETSGRDEDLTAGERRGTSGPGTDDAMTRSEERLRVGTEQVPAVRVRLRKYVVTENVTTTVPVSHEEVRVEREPVTDADRDAALSGEPISEAEHDVILQAERPVVQKEAVPVERVRLDTDIVTEEQEVSEQVRKEQIEEPDIDTGQRS